jgi:hypothetical protein
MKLNLSALAVAAALSALAATPTFAVDFAYFQKQSCTELGKESDSLVKAEAAITDGKKKKSSEAQMKNAVGFLLTGWPFWGTADHGNSDAQLAEIRADLKMIKAAQKTNKCSAWSVAEIGVPAASAVGARPDPIPFV